MSKPTKKAATVQPMATSKTNEVYAITERVRGASPSTKSSYAPCSQLWPSTDTTVDLFNPEKWAELAKRASRSDQVAEPAQQPFEEGTHFYFDYIVGLRGVPALGASDCAAEPRAHDVFDGRDSVGHSGGGEALTTQVEGDGRVSP